MIKRFFIYGLAGWTIEIFWTGLHSLLRGDMTLGAFTNLWMFFIYGCAVFLEPIHDIIVKWPWVARGVIWAVIIWGMEYTSGLLLLKAVGVYAWEYTGPFAVDGLVMLSYGPAWAVAGLLFERLHRLLDSFQIA